MRSALALLLAGGCATVGNADRGREVFISREQGHCVLCHTLPGTAGGNVGPPLAGVGSRLSREELRVRIEDMSRVNPQAAMPAYHRTADLRRVDPRYRGKPVLSREQVDDLVAFLSTLE